MPTDGTHRDVQFPARRVTTSLAMAPAKEPEPAAKEPFAFADFSWVPGNYGSSDRPLTWGPFTGELRVDTVYHYSFANPKDNTISGSSEVFRHNEFQVTQIGICEDDEQLQSPASYESRPSAWPRLWPYGRSSRRPHRLFA